VRAAWCARRNMAHQQCEAQNAARGRWQAHEMAAASGNDATGENEMSDARRSDARSSCRCQSGEARETVAKEAAVTMTSTITHFARYRAQRRRRRDAKHTINYRSRKHRDRQRNAMRHFAMRKSERACLCAPYPAQWRKRAARTCNDDAWRYVYLKICRDCRRR